MYYKWAKVDVTQPKYTCHKHLIVGDPCHLYDKSVRLVCFSVVLIFVSSWRVCFYSGSSSSSSYFFSLSLSRSNDIQISFHCSCIFLYVFWNNKTQINQKCSFDLSTTSNKYIFIYKKRRHENFFRKENQSIRPVTILNAISVEKKFNVKLLQILILSTSKIGLHRKLN